jgi:6-phosphogluconolactonase (cycloisomerase 2 family)
LQATAFAASLQTTKFTSLIFIAVLELVTEIGFFIPKTFAQSPTPAPSYQQTVSVDGGAPSSTTTIGPFGQTGNLTAASTDIELLPVTVGGVQTLNGSSMSEVMTTGTVTSTASASTKATYYVEVDTSVSPPPSTVALDVVGTITESVGSAQGQATAFVGFGEAALLPQFPLSISTGAADMSFPFNVEVNVTPNTALPIVLATSVSLSGLLGTVSAQIDPYVRLDPSVQNAQQYQVTFLTTPPSQAEFLYVVNPRVGIIGFSIGSDGALTPIAGSPFTVNSPQGIAVVPSGKFAYVVNGNLLAYSIGSNGAPTLIGTYAAGNGNLLRSFFFDANRPDLSATDPRLKIQLPRLDHASGAGEGYRVITDPLGKFVYVASALSESGQIYGFSIGSDGTLTPVPGSPTAVGKRARILAIEPDREFMYVSDDFYWTKREALSVYAIGVDGALTALPHIRLPIDLPTFAAAPDPNGKFLYGLTGFHDISAFNVGDEGALTPLPGSPLRAGRNPTFLTVDPTGTHVYLSHSDGGYVSAYSIASDGALTLIPGSNVATGVSPSTIAVDPTGQFVYVANTGSSSISAYRTGSNGVLTPIPGSPFTISPYAEPLSLVIAP